MKSPSRSTAILIATDIISFAVSLLFAFGIRSGLRSIFPNPLFIFPGFWSLVALNLLILLLVFGLVGLYQGYGMVAVVELKRITQSIFVTFIIISFSIFMLGQGELLSRAFFGLLLMFNLLLIPLFRFIVHNRFSNKMNWGKKVAVIGKSLEEVEEIVNRLIKVRRLGMTPSIILITDTNSGEIQEISGVPIVPFSTEQCKNLIENGISIAFYSSRLLSGEDLTLNSVTFHFPIVYYVLPESALSSTWLDVVDLLGRPALKSSFHITDKFSQIVKRFLEFIISLLSVIVLFPLGLIISLLIYINDRGPVFYSQKRLGKDGRIIRVFKFRTMVENAEDILSAYLAGNEEAFLEYEKFHKLEHDPRVTKIGRFLRRYSLDELPQLINVLRGDLNLVGPRAYMVDELDVEDRITKTILKVRPGVTGWWQVMERNEASFDQRLKLDVYYISNWSLWVDYYILIKTFWIVIAGRGK